MRYIILIVLLLAGCATAPSPPSMSLQRAESMCATSTNFSDHAECVQRIFNFGYPNWRSLDRDSDLLNLYFQWMNAASAKIAEGVLREADANAQGVLLYSGIIQTGMQRNAQARAQQFAEQQSRIQNALLGLSIMQATNPAPPAPVVAPTVRCTSTTMVGGTVQTVCH